MCIRICEVFEVIGRQHILMHLEMAISDAEALVLTVGHKELCLIDPRETAEKTPARLAFDMIHGWDVELWQQAGFKLKGLGQH